MEIRRERPTELVGGLKHTHGGVVKISVDNGNMRVKSSQPFQHLHQLPVVELT